MSTSHDRLWCHARKDGATCDLIKANPLLLFDSRRTLHQVLVSRVTSSSRVHAEGVDMVGMSLACQQTVHLSLDMGFTAAFFFVVGAGVVVWLLGGRRKGE